MSSSSEVTVTVRLTKQELIEVAQHARACHAEPEHWIAETVRVSLMERRCPGSEVRLLWEQVHKLKGEVVRLSQEAQVKP